MHDTLRPLERCWVVVSSSGKPVDRRTDLPRVGGAQVLEYRAGEDAESYLNLVEPGGVGGRVMEVNQGVTAQPPVVFGLVRHEVVQDHVELRVRILRDDAVHEIEELPAPSAAVVAGMDQSLMYLQGGEEGRGAVALVLVGVSPQRPPVGEAQPPLGPLQGLDRRLFIDAQDHDGAADGATSPHRA